MRTALVSSLLLVLATGCASQLEAIEDEGGEDGGSAMPAYVAEAFGRACTGAAGCHVAGGTSPELTATAAPALLDGTAAAVNLPWIELGSLENSYIAIKMLPDELLPDGFPRPGGQMPLPGPDVDPADLAIIVGWIGSTVPGVDGGSSDSGGTDDMGMDTATDDAATGVAEVQACGIEDVAPGTANPIMMGDAADLIPMPIGTILGANCGCHFAEATDLIMGAPAPQAPPTGSDLSTLAGIQANTAGITARVGDVPSAMPPTYFCDERDGFGLAQADQDMLKSWLDAGAPDGATWMP